MKHSILRPIILVLGLITTIVHLVILNVSFIQDTGLPDPLFTLNGLSFLLLTVVYVFRFSFLARLQRVIPWALVAFASITILAWYFMNGLRSPLGWLTKLDEVLLILAVLADQRAAH